MRDDRQYINELTYSDIEFPICEKQYNKIEKQNNINVNIFGFEVKQFFPIYMSKEHSRCIESFIEKRRWEKALRPQKRLQFSYVL